MTACEKHGIELRIRWAHEGTPRQDFDGFYCPECEAERKVKCEKKEHWQMLLNEAYDIETTIRLRMPYDGFLEQRGPEAYNNWYAKMLEKYF